MLNPFKDIPFQKNLKIVLKLVHDVIDHVNVVHTVLIILGVNFTSVDISHIFIKFGGKIFPTVHTIMCVLFK